MIADSKHPAQTLLKRPHDRIVETFSDLREDEEFKLNYTEGYALNIDEAISFALGISENIG